MDKLNTFLQLRKVDEATRRVYCEIDETPDHAREIFDYAGSKPHFEAWSKAQQEASDGASYGNIRGMHTKIAAGIVPEPLIFDDARKSVGIWAEVTDDAEWKKVQTRTYTGFSPGGSYGRKWADTVHKGFTRYIAVPTEVSLVDKPCIPSATFQFVKMDGTVEDLPFAAWAPTNDEVKAEAAVLAKVAGKPDLWKDYVAKARDILLVRHEMTAGEDVLEKDAVAPPAAEPDADAAALEAALAKATAAETAATDLGPFGDLAKIGPALVAIVEAGRKSDPLAKGLYDVQWLAELMSCFASLQTCMQCEADWEGDNSELPAKAAKILADMGALLVAQAQEEVAEVVALAGEDLVIVGEVDVLELATKITDLVKADTALMEKAGARNSKSDAAHIQAAHDHMTSLGATCDSGNCPADDAEKAATADALAKSHALEKAAHNSALLKRATDAITRLTERHATRDSEVAELRKELDALKAQPGARKGVLLITKGMDVSPGEETAPDDKLEKDAAGWPIDPLARREHARRLLDSAGYAPGGGPRA